MTLEQLILILMPFAGLSIVVAFIFWQNRRESLAYRAQSKKK
jgi:hypothetical protein